MDHKSPPSKIKGYRNCKIIESTNNSFVYIAKKNNINHDKVILKYIPFDGEIHIEQIDFECNIQKNLQNQYIMPLIDYFDIPGFRVLEMPVALKNLDNLDSLTNISQIYKIMQQVALGVEYLHSKKVLHGDIKPKNIVLMNNDLENPLVRIIDFGFAKKFSNSNDNNCYCKCNRITFGFSAPELISKEPHTFSADVWSLGATFYYLITGQSINSYSYYKESARFLCYDSKFGSVFPESGKKLINSMLSPNPFHRPTAREIVNSAFFKEVIINYFALNHEKYPN